MTTIVLGLTVLGFGLTTYYLSIGETHATRTLLGLVALAAALGFLLAYVCLDAEAGVLNYAFVLGGLFLLGLQVARFLNRYGSRLVAQSSSAPG